MGAFRMLSRRAAAGVVTALLFLAACGSPNLRPRLAVTDNELNGTWLLTGGTLAGKPFAAPGFELTMSDNAYSAGVPPQADRGSLVFFGDELAGEARRLDVVGEAGPNKGKRYPAIYRFIGSQLEICYDLAEQTRPVEFLSREGTRVFCATYRRKP